MLEIVTGSGFALRPGDRILDLGCGAGRMIRHLRPSRRHLRGLGRRHQRRPYIVVQAQFEPALPLRHHHQGAASAVRGPQLPADLLRVAVHPYRRSRRRLAARIARRVLAPAGRGCLSVPETRSRISDARITPMSVVRTIKAARAYQEAKASFGMFTVARDNKCRCFTMRKFRQHGRADVRPRVGDAGSLFLSDRLSARAPRRLSALGSDSGPSRE